MSKVDGPRAMRDARYAAYQASRTAAGAPPAPAKARVTAAPARDELQESPDTLMPAPEGGAAVAKAKPARAKASATSPQQEETLDGAAAATPDGEGELCGHRNMGGKSCQRPAGHEEKNHRYK